MGLFSNITRAKEAKAGLDQMDASERSSTYKRMGLVVGGIAIVIFLIKGIAFLAS